MMRRHGSPSKIKVIKNIPEEKQNTPKIEEKHNDEKAREGQDKRD